MVRLLVWSVSLVALGAVAAGCGSPPPTPEDGMLDVGDLAIVYSEVGGVHNFGSSPCPQPVGSIVVTNDSMNPIALDVTVPGTQIEIWEVDEVGLTTPWAARELAAGESVELVVRFNCTSTTDVATTITITGTPTGGTAQTGTIPITLRIDGEP